MIKGIQASESDGVMMESKVREEALKVIGDWLTEPRTAMRETQKTSEEDVAQDLVDGP